ncbi:hypothetical protein [Williamsia deligens]|uniref:Uncharacterized protein n=1 Tax=Williamsia deligens TaxID=321325 RepID=A0ABW3G2N6_9NOCA|nr:hypothetical protein [Williamsia deligens]MCP2194273.1 hypothetical protein [Williamsia deligens]
MRKTLIGSFAASLAIAGAAVALTPAIASASSSGFLGYEASIVDPTGASQSLDSPFGNKLKIEFALPPTEARQTCSLTVYANGNDEKPVVKTTIPLRAVPNTPISAGTKTVTLKPATYYVVTRCEDKSGTSSANAEDLVTIQNKPANVLSGTARCYLQDKAKFAKPTSLIFSSGNTTVKARLSTAPRDTANASTTSAFTASVYSTADFTANLGCGGTASKPGKVQQFGPYAAGTTGIALQGD